MKKLLVLATAAFLFTGVAFAHEGGKDKKKASGKECCKKDANGKESCKKDGKDCCSKDKEAKETPKAKA
jgi:hypothetical protein